MSPEISKSDSRDDKPSDYTPLGHILNRSGIKQILVKTLGEPTYLKLRSRVLSASGAASQTKTRVVQEASNAKTDGQMKQFAKSGGLRWKSQEFLTPDEAYEHNAHLVMKALGSSGVEWWTVKTAKAGRSVFGVDAADRIRLIEAFAAFAERTDEPLYVMDATGRNPQYQMETIDRRAYQETEVLRICSPQRSVKDQRRYGFAYGADVEFWTIPSTDSLPIQAPRENAAAKTMSRIEFSLTETRFLGVPCKTPTVFTKNMLDDITFPIDAVYTWVDGSDISWKTKRDSHLPDSVRKEVHSEAVDDARFRSRDELKYSLRSIDYFAPWIRKIYIVTDGQVPYWLDTTNPKIEIVDHRDIFESQDHIPTFNSNSIISRIHHIKNLSEHFIYFNDDVLLGRPVQPTDFFTPAGLALVSPSSNRRPFGNATVADEPHINLTRNIRRLIEDRFGVLVSRAIKHTPHPLIKSVLFAMETDFKQDFENTWTHKFRHHEDIVADQLHHYYAQILGKAVPGTLSYNYINILDDRYRGVLHSTLVKHDRDAFCINDAPVSDASPIPEYLITDFFETYFPRKSRFER